MIVFRAGIVSVFFGAETLLISSFRRELLLTGLRLAAGAAPFGPQMRAASNDEFPPRPWKNAFVEAVGPTSAVRLRQGLRADPGTQARIACSSGPTPMIAITRLML